MAGMSDFARREPMRIRDAGTPDRDFILGLADRFAEFELPSWRSRDVVAQGTARRLDAAIGRQSDDSIVVIAESPAGEPLGFAWLLLVEDFYTGRRIGKLSEIAVVRDGTGAGAALVAHAEGWARAHGAPLLILNVMGGNAHARRFYERHGFAEEYTMMVKPLD
jgi:GNAT superfamily N-acetyltransferase